MQNEPLDQEVERYLTRHRLEKKFDKQLRLFLKNPRHPSLHTERLEPKPAGLYSFRIDRKYRGIVDVNLGLRFFYYAFGNLWLDRFIIRPHIERSNTHVFQDRSWLSTLTAHDLLGVSTFWMNRVYSLAKTATQPIQAFVLHVDNEERRKRLLNRETINPGDLKSLDLIFEQTTESKYVEWGKRLGWSTYFF